MPVFFAFMATTALLMVNVQSIYFLLHLLQPKVPLVSKYYVIPLIFGIGLTNYLALYRNRHYKTIFDNFDKERTLYKKWKLSIQLYIIVSLFLLVAVLSVADLKNHGHI